MRLLAILLLSACTGGGQEDGYVIRTGGNASRGLELVTTHHCGACHVIPDVTGANGMVGPSLSAFGRRTFIAGDLPNVPANLTAFVKDPHRLEPKTAMPSLGLDDGQARDIAAYLYTLR